MDSSSRAAREPVRLGDGQHVAVAHEGQTLGELHPFGDATDLFPEDAFGTGRRQVADRRSSTQHHPIDTPGYTGRYSIVRAVITDGCPSQSKACRLLTI